MAAPCCARIDGKLIGLKNDLRRAAAREARLHQKGKSTVATVADIDAIKIRIALSEARKVDHEAEHAGEVAP